MADSVEEEVGAWRWRRKGGGNFGGRDYRGGEGVWRWRRRGGRFGGGGLRAEVDLRRRRQQPISEAGAATAEEEEEEDSAGAAGTTQPGRHSS